ncbi:MAG: phytanoyl-CoA dioxygenase family protein [Verrucomicrobia bacterium]|nr:phytanoyl-CoA dioxygenase family protein [Verrucomicrobiota bacterium]
MTLISDQQLEQFNELGFFVTEPMWGPDQLEPVRREFERLYAQKVAEFEKSGDAHRIDMAKYRPFIGEAHRQSEVLKAFVKSPIYLEACAKLIGPDADLYYNQIVIKPPEKGRHFGWHQDSGYVVTEPLEYITCWTSITRSFIENGCIWVIPGSHKRGFIEHQRNTVDTSTDAQIENEDGAIPVEVEPGQVAIFSSLTLHKSGANTSTEPRYGYVPQYHVPGVVRADTGERFGDQFPILRGGQPV